MRAAEAVAARDVIAQHLSFACKSIRDKSAIIDTLRQQNKHLEDILKGQTSAYTPTKSEQPPPAGQEVTCVELVDEKAKIKGNAMKEQPSSNMITEEEPPKYEATEALSQV
jgi:hypothetical protein